MATLGKPSGIFRLDDSDNWVGSFLRRADVVEILGVEDDALSALRFKTVDGEEVIDENVLHKSWREVVGPARLSDLGTKVSLNELTLAAICKRAYPDATVEHQVQVVNSRTKRKNSMDLKISIPGKEPVFIEFEGPYHFVPFRPGRSVANPFQRKWDIEDSVQVEVVNWPYWIHECEKNVRALFEPDVVGIGSLWSTNIHFGDFVVDDPSIVIETMTARFNAAASEGIGYLYEENARGMHKPAHPIVDQILADKESKKKLIPAGASDVEWWLPAQLR